MCPYAVSYSVVSYSLQPYGCTPPGSSVYGIFQARTFAISTPGDLPDSGIESASPEAPALANGLFTTGAAWESLCYRQLTSKYFIHTYACMHTHTHTHTHTQGKYGKWNKCCIFEVYGCWLHHPINFTIFWKLVIIKTCGKENLEKRFVNSQ